MSSVRSIDPERRLNSADPGDAPPAAPVEKHAPATAPQSNALSAAGTGSPRRAATGLFRKYVLLLSAAVGLPLLASGILQILFAYRELDDFLDRLQREQADGASAKIEQFVRQIEDQIGWTVQLPWGADSLPQRRFDALRLLRQVPAITDLSMLDPSGKEQLRVSRVSADVFGSERDFSTDPRFAGALSQGSWFAPVYFREESEPYASIAVAGNRRSAGVSIAEVNLKLVWDIVTQIRAGTHGAAYVVDRSGRLIAHPDLSLVLANTDMSSLPQVRDVVGAAALAAGSETDVARNLLGRRVFSARAPIPTLGWWVFVELPLEEAYAPIYAAMLRSAALVVLGLLIAVGVAFQLARQMTGPIRALREGARRIGEGDLSQTIDVRTGDELEDLAHQFNRMVGELRALYDNLDRVNQLKRYFSPQLAEMIVASTDSILGESHRRDITVVFCDLRNFTAFSTSFGPDVVIQVLGSFFEVIGGCVRRSGATVGHFGGDGLMAFFNDPLPCADHQLHAVAMAAAMRREVGHLVEDWRPRGIGLGFGVGIASGAATLGDIGSPEQFHYTAIGPVVNLASRLCDLAEGGQILVDEAVGAAIAGKADVAFLGPRRLKGFPDDTPIFRLDELRFAPDDLIRSGSREGAPESGRYPPGAEAQALARRAKEQEL